VVTWPDPLKMIDDMIASATQPGGHKITWFWSTGHSGAEIEKFLRSYGVRVWRRQYEERNGDVSIYGLTVRKSQAKWACTLLLTYNVAIRSGRVKGARAMASLPRTSWNSIAPAVGLGGIVSEMIIGKPKATNTRPRRKSRAWR